MARKRKGHLAPIIFKLLLSNIHWVVILSGFLQSKCYQAQKFVSEQQREKIRVVAPLLGEKDSPYGMRVWRLGQSGECRHDWDSVNLREMFLINIAKYACNPQLCTELLDTGDFRLTGAPSTWQWSKWNGLIQMRIRKLLRDNIDLTQVTEVQAQELEFESMAKLIEDSDEDI